MMSRDFVALVASDGPISHPKNVQSVSFGGYTGIFGARLAVTNRRARRHLVAGLTARQQLLEALMDQTTVLPVLPGTRLVPEHLPTFINANHDMLQKMRGSFAGKVQFQVSVAWDPEEALERFDWATDKDAQRGTEQIVRTAEDALTEACVDTLELPRDADMLLNKAVLIERNEEHALDRALVLIDAIWSEGLRIRQVGPSPAVSFGSLGVRHVTAKATRSARGVLGLSSDANQNEINSARRVCLLRATPENRTAIDEAAMTCTAALRAGRDHFPLAYTWSEGQAAQADELRQVA